MKILSFDTSTKDLHLALAEGNKVVAAQQIGSDVGNRQYAASELIPGIDAILKEVGWHKTELDAIAVGAGPGSFTGVRAAAVTARTLSQALGIAACTVNIFDCYALEWSSVTSEGRGNSFAIILDAGREHCYLAKYEAFDRSANAAIGSQVKPASEPSCLKMSDLINKLNNDGSSSKPTLLADSTMMTRLESHGIKSFPVPELNNVAALQSTIVLDRLSLNGGSANGNDGKPSHDLRESLLRQFPYSQVHPLYLREASVTLKGASK